VLTTRRDLIEQNSTEDTLLVEERAERLHNGRLARPGHVVKPKNMRRVRRCCP
jgi:hypothetical protein